MEVTPFNQSTELVEFCGDNSMIVLNNEPMCKGLRDDNDTLQFITDTLGSSSVAQTLLQWSFNKGFAVALPQSSLAACGAASAAGAVAASASAEALLEPLPLDAIAALDSLEESLKTTWAPLNETEEEK